MVLALWEGLVALLALFGRWIVQRFGSLALVSGVTYFGQEVGLVQPVLDATGDMLADTALAAADGFLEAVVSEYGGMTSSIPNAHDVMSGMPQFSVQALAAVGVWWALSILLGLLVTRSVMDAIPARGFGSKKRRGD